MDPNKLQALAAVMQLSQGPGMGDITQLAQLAQRDREFQQGAQNQQLASMMGMADLFMRDADRQAQGGRADRGLDIQERGVGLQEQSQKDAVARWMQEQALKERMAGVSTRQAEAQIGNFESLDASREMDRKLSEFMLKRFMASGGGGQAEAVGLDPGFMQKLAGLFRPEQIQR